MSLAVSLILQGFAADATAWPACGAALESGLFRWYVFVKEM